MHTLTFLDYLSFVLMLCFWLSYDVYARYRVNKGDKTLMGLSNSLRTHWIYNFMQQPSYQRIGDAQVIALLHRGISFFISITIFIIAGLMAILSSGDDAMLYVLDSIPFHATNYAQTWTFKIIIMLIVFVVAFFRLTWALRQSQYYAIALLGAPQTQLSDTQDYKLIRTIANLMSDSGKNFNNGLRSYYFGLSIMMWLINPLLFISSTIIVIWVIYRREFASKTFKMMNDINTAYNQYSDDREYKD